MKRLLLSILAACALLSTALAGQSYATPTAAPTAQTAHRAPPTDTTAPGPVTGLTVSGNTLHSISLEWRNPENADLAHVLIRRAVGDQPPLSGSDGTLVAVLGSHATEFTDRKLDSGTTYSYAVYASDRQQNLSSPSTLTALTLTINDQTGVKGVLTDKQGGPIAETWVIVRLNGAYAGSTTPGSDGSWRITNLAPGTYTVCYETTPSTHGPSPTGYLSGCYRQQPFLLDGSGGTPITVRAGKMTTGIRDYLPVAGAFSGRFTDPSGAGIGNVHVYIIEVALQHASEVTSAADGSYTYPSLPAGNYYVCFSAGRATGASSAGYVDECYDNQVPWSGGGTAVPVSLGHTTTGINATLAVGGAVTGKVTDPVGNPMPGLDMYLMPSSGQSQGGLGATDAQGVYRIIGIVPGAYTFCVTETWHTSPSAPYGYARECPESGPGFEVTAGQTTTHNISLRVAGAIGGSVSGSDGSPVPSVWTKVFDPSGAEVDSTITDENGYWELAGLGAGQYTVCYDTTFTNGNYRRGCYDSQPNGATTGTLVTVAEGQLTTVNDSLEPGATITGAVTDSTSSGLAWVVVWAVTPGGTRVRPVYTDDTGRYTLSGLDAGSYLVCFNANNAQGPASGFGTYRSECYDNQPSVETADPVTVGAIDTVRIDAQLAFDEWDY
ncbi:MAG TPA: carboxypeptidase regulatory-like domain-containing protein [Jatrophihabitans sp.]|jgi:hypothetical protein|uniref:carboxypeptidase regulatory-like domain-containing protein n=1 Tax=Jatrophihabitans sp. TaxID=1932789 RepID=UPI002F12DBC7